MTAWGKLLRVWKGRAFPPPPAGPNGIGRQLTNCSPMKNTPDGCKRELHGNVILRFFGAAEFLLLYRHKHLVRNNGLMRAGIEIPFHEAIVFDLDSAGADRFLEQHPLQKSEAIKNGLRKGFQDGSSKMAKRKCYGYTINSDGELEINPDEAKVVSWIFERYLAGDSLGKIFCFSFWTALNISSEIMASWEPV